MARPPEIGNVTLYPDRPLRDSDKNGFVLKFYCPIQGKRIRKNAGTRDRREARKIVRECSTRLTNGEYVASGGLISAEQEKVRKAIEPVVPQGVFSGVETDSGRSWDACKDQYLAYKKKRVRDSSYADITSRLDLAERIIVGYREDNGLQGVGSIQENCTLSAMEYLQDRLLAGDECRYDYRSPMTVNTAMGAIMAFVRYCARHEWIDKVPIVDRLEVDNPMKGRPISESEYEAMLKATPKVVGESATDSWRFVLRIIWTTAFRVGDVMSFSWDDETEIHPLWKDDRREHPTIAIPTKQKNRKKQEIPMLPELEQLLVSILQSHRTGWIANPQPLDSQNALVRRPTRKQLTKLKKSSSNTKIAEIYGVSEAAVRKWLLNPNSLSQRSSTISQPPNLIQRLTKERVGRVIALIGKEADIVVQDQDVDQRKRLKYASAHDIRRGCAQRLINQGVSAESLKLILRHADFATTEKFYGAVKSVQSASSEIRKLVSAVPDKQAPDLSAAEVAKLRQLLSQI
jgi:integrase